MNHLQEPNNKQVLVEKLPQEERTCSQDKERHQEQKMFPERPCQYFCNSLVKGLQHDGFLKWYYMKKRILVQ